MKAVAIFPGKPDSVHATEMPSPSLDEIPNGRGVLVKVLQVGLDGTDREINAAEYGAAPPGQDFLVLGHESFGIVEQVGSNVNEVAPGDYVVSLVRRPGNSVYDAIGMSDMTTDDTYYEKGINLLHGFLTERYVAEPQYLVKVPATLRDIGVILEPMSVIEKGIIQAYEIQRRLRVWQPKRAAVLGAGTIGLLATIVLRIKGLEVVTLANTKPPYLNSDLIEAIGGRYVSTTDMSLTEASEKYGPFDLMFEATGFSPLAFEAMEVLGKNGVLVLSSVTGGGREIHVPSDAINLGFVLGNKVMVGTVNANREHFEAGVRDITQAEAFYPGWMSRLLTHPVNGLDNYQKAFEILNGTDRPIKVYIDVAPMP